MKRIYFFILAVALGFSAALLPGNLKSPASAGPVIVPEERATILAVQSVSPAVVSIVMKQKLTVTTGAALRIVPGVGVEEIPGRQETVEREVSRGTGFIVRKDGVVVTNRHVVDLPHATATVFLSDGQSVGATVLAKDPTNDLAILKLASGGSYQTVRLGDSDGIEVGATVVALGNSLGRYQNTVTKGVVSGLGRSITASDGSGLVETLSDIIQTDAAINPGNSGGPLINLQGEVVGINTAVDQQGQSIGFAIPVNAVKPAMVSVLQKGRIVRPRLGIRYVMITPEIREARGLSVDEGAYLVAGPSGEPAVLPGSPGDISGLREGDSITHINGKAITRARPLQTVVSRLRVGDKVKITLVRGKKTQNLAATLDEAPQ